MPMIVNSAYGSYVNDSFAMAADAYAVKSLDLSELKTWVHVGKGLILTKLETILLFK
jgi:hypothetical protein